MAVVQQGQIVWAEVPDSAGRNPKVRPVVIISVAESIPEGEPYVGVAVTTQLPAPLPEEYVLLPFNRDARRVQTRLTERSAAICTWLVLVHEAAIQRLAGRVPG